MRGGRRLRLVGFLGVREEDAQPSVSHQAGFRGSSPRNKIVEPHQGWVAGLQIAALGAGLSQRGKRPQVFAVVIDTRVVPASAVRRGFRCEREGAGDERKQKPESAAVNSHCVMGRTAASHGLHQYDKDRSKRAFITRGGTRESPLKGEIVGALSAAAFVIHSGYALHGVCADDSRWTQKSSNQNARRLEPKSARTVSRLAQTGSISGSVATAAARGSWSS